MKLKTLRLASGVVAIAISVAAADAPGSTGSGSLTASPGAAMESSAFKPFAIYASEPPSTHYTPSGYMGDPDLLLSAANIPSPIKKSNCLKLVYKAQGPKGWSGIYWQNPPNNWGEIAGQAGYDLRGATRLVFWARGEKGGERIHEFRVGGIVGKYPDSDVATLANVKLTSEWKEFSIDLTKKDLRHIIGGFGVFLSKAEARGGITFYLTDIVFEGAEAPAVPAEPVVEAPPVVITPPPAAEVPNDLEIKEVEEGLKVSFSSQLLFETGKTVLGSKSERSIQELVALLNAYPTNRVLIEGHTDKTGGAALNLKLSELRARAVRDALIKQGGFEEGRFQVVGYGDTRPIADNKTAAGRSLNRRVEVTILKSKP